MRKITLFSILLLFTACANNKPKDVKKTVNQHIVQDEYEKALQVINKADSATTDANLTLLREKVHLNYGLFLEYRGQKDMTMRSRMTGALRQYIKVLQVNPNNQKARAEIEKIMNIYATMPQSPSDDIMKDLQKLGFDM